MRKGVLSGFKRSLFAPQKDSFCRLTGTLLRNRRTAFADMAGGIRGVVKPSMEYQVAEPVVQNAFCAVLRVGHKDDGLASSGKPLRDAHPLIVG